MQLTIQLEINDKGNNAELLKFAKVELNNFEESMGKIAQGKLELPFQNYDYYFSRIDAIQKTLMAISVYDPQAENGFAWWASPIGEKYWKRNLKLKQKGVHIERIFIYKIRDSFFEKLVDEHLQAKMDVYCIPGKLVQPEYKVNTIIFDSDLVYELETSTDGVPIRHHYFNAQKAVEKKIQAFKSLKSRYATEEERREKNQTV